MPSRSRLGIVAERALLIVGAPLVFLLVAELVLAITGLDTDLARNKNAKIAVPVWLLADENWVRDRQTKLRRSGGKPIEAEEVAWLYHFEEARYIQYKLKPGIEVQVVNPFNEIEVQHKITFELTSNRAGFRDREMRPKAPGMIRIVTLGDSSTFGWGVDADHTYQRVLESLLGERYPRRRFEVLNLGMPGYNSRHGIGVLEHYALELDPDVLIFSFGANDARLVLVPTAVVLDRDDSALAGVRFGLLKLRTYRLLRKAIFTLRDPIAAKEAPTLVPAVSLAEFEDNLRRLIRESAQRGARSVLLSVCTGVRTYAAALRNVAAEQRVPSVDVRALFSDKIEAVRSGELLPQIVQGYRTRYGARALQERQSLYVTSDGCHPHHVGHTLIAQELVQVVDRLLHQPALPNSPGDSP